MANGKNPRPVNLLIILAVVAGLGLFLCAVGAPFALMAIQQAREAARRQQAENNLRQLETALKNYHDTHPVQDKQVESLSEQRIRDLAEQYKNEWLEENREEALANAPISEIGKADDGWHVTFENVAVPGDPEGDGHHFLRVHIDGEGRLIEVVREVP